MRQEMISLLTLQSEHAYAYGDYEQGQDCAAIAAGHDCYACGSN